jgi:hypothetical protein
VRVLLSFCVFSLRGEESIKYPTSTLHYLYFFSDILVVSYVLSCAEPAESDRNGSYSAGAVAAWRQNGFSTAQRASARGVVHSSQVRMPQDQVCEPEAQESPRADGERGVDLTYFAEASMLLAHGGILQLHQG